MKELMFSAMNQNVAFSSWFENRLSMAKKRIDCLDQFRIHSALRNHSDDFQFVFSVLPALVHYNIPELPTYVENAPKGIFNFSLSSTQKAHLSTYFPLVEENKSIAFDGLYVMGSIGSITQTRFSDLDLWLCHSQSFTETESHLLQKKLGLIQKWAKQYGIDVNFYLMNPNTFKDKKYNSDVSDEHNGSAQHFFLLDEFYRSSIRLAGKRILWLHIDNEEQNYDDFVQQAVLSGKLNSDEWVDFGDFSSLAIDEYFGASLWQLYKGIESPYKAVIKILLLESYAETYPETPLISKKFKHLLLSDKAVSYHFDPYLAMLEQVTTYLQNRKEFVRLNRLRSYFYIKAYNGQYDPLRKEILKELVSAWNWSEKEVQCLNNNENWKVKQAIIHQQMIVEQLLQSYRHLIQFARKFHIDPSILPQDTDILMRKLYSAFEVVPGKISLINQNIGKNLAEDEVTFIEVTEGVSTKEGWYLINHAPLSSYDSTTRHVQYQRTLIKAIAWAYFNRVITASTQIHLVSQSVSLEKLRRFITDLRLSFPATTPILRDEDLYHPNEIRNLIVAINLVEDPTKELPLLSRTDTAQIDLFNLGSSEKGMIGSMSIIYRNMWNEIMTQHFDGNDALLKSLKFISNKIYRSSAPPQSVNVVCYSSQLRNELQSSVMSLVNRCITIQTGSIFQRQKPQTFKMAGKQWQLIFDKKNQLKDIVVDDNQDNLINTQQTEFHIPKEIFDFASEGFLQFFFEDNIDGSFNVYVLDKKNQTETYRYCLGEKENKVKKISRLYTENNDTQQKDSFGSFNFPQFYQLLKQNERIFIVPFQSKQHRDFLEK
ncbi:MULTISPECIES: class I adenylate cyclase [Glaesserella]|uniref:Adenylate cyclase n=1 Tax=Glaesserella australis TaxID=2094024 RepID=A0A328BY90_9PAST|nr:MULTISPECIES: class I adenylate cyclase [Glaesserella]AUI66448.1 adenylate cyclase [Glaesserella sp. 15-184]RAL19338.1 class I adenylate cyclase [Glaesserella australis]